MENGPVSKYWRPDYEGNVWRVSNNFFGFLDRKKEELNVLIKEKKNKNKNSVTNCKFRGTFTSNAIAV